MKNPKPDPDRYGGPVGLPRYTISDGRYGRGFHAIIGETPQNYRVATWSDYKGAYGEPELLPKSRALLIFRSHGPASHAWRALAEMTAAHKAQLTALRKSHLEGREALLDGFVPAAIGGSHVDGV